MRTGKKGKEEGMEGIGEKTEEYNKFSKVWVHVSLLPYIMFSQRREDLQNAH